MVQKKLNKKSAQGIGTLIIFIALILVAAIAAGVLIQTSTSLQSKSLDVGKQTQSRITTDLEVVQIKAEGTGDSVINANTDHMTVSARLSAGSDIIKLEDIVVSIITPTDTQTLNYADSPTTSTTFNATYLSNGGNPIRNGYLTAGEFLEIRILSGLEINESDKISFTFVTKTGISKSIHLTVPNILFNSNTHLYP